jgi:trimeric autotransporter adhesin
MRNLASSLKQTCISGFSFFTFLLALLAVSNQPAFAFQIPADAGNAWTVAGTTASKSTPSGVRVNVAITGAPISFSALNNTSLMAGVGAAGTPVGTFLTPALPLATNGLQILAALGATCQASNPNDLTCNTFGTVTYTFTDAAGLPIAVRNPVMHVSRVGGFSQAGGNSLYAGVTHTLTSAGATLGAPSAGSVGLNVAGAVMSPALTTASVWDGTCPAAAATVTAGCGSIPITGTVSTLAFNIGALRHNNIATTPWNTNASAAADAWYVTFSFDEDFGDAPASYQGNVAALATAPASHIQTALTLGSAWTAANNNTTILNGTSAGAANFSASPAQVAAGADNNGAIGDGTEENGLATPLTSITTNQIGTTYTLTPTLSGTTRAGTVCGWIDFNRDGAFTAAEGVCTPFAAGAASAALNWTIPTATTAGRAYVRIRASYATMTTASFVGLQNSGEVEDYNLEIKPTVRVLKVLTPAGDTGIFDLSIAGSNFATAVGNGGTTGFKSVYQSTTTANDVTVASDIAIAPVTGVVLTEAGAGGTLLTSYSTTSACTNAAGTAVIVGGTALAPSVTIPQSLTGASANGQAQTITCTLTNTRLPALSVTKTVSQSPLVVGQTGQFYTITIAVSGNATTTPITLADALPTGITTSGAITATGGSLNACPAAGAVNINSCVILAGASVGSIVINVPINVGATATTGTNTVTASGGGDPACTGTAPACTGSTLNTLVTRVASLAITKTDNKAQSIPGSTNDYVIILSNQGPSPADGVVVSDVVGTGLTCPTTNPVTCSVTAVGALCPAGPLTFADLLSGLTVATFPANSALQFAYACNVN